MHVHSSAVDAVVDCQPSYWSHTPLADDWHPPGELPSHCGVRHHLELSANTDTVATVCLVSASISIISTASITTNNVLIAVTPSQKKHCRGLRQS